MKGVEGVEEVIQWDPLAANGGDVANGSFENVAPFGGYGWRYRGKSGVQRIHDEAEAYDGEHYVKLDRGEGIHQPNPASNGQVVTVTLWLRAQTDGDDAIITIDFRDQKMWTTPLGGEQFVVELTTEWQQFEFTSQAPVVTPRRVFHTRLTIGPGARSVVFVDDVQMSTQ